MDRRELEIMAPAGNFGCLTAAVEGGANSVYFGIGHLNMRSHSANNFSREDLPEIMRICRAYGIRGYMTLNITLFGEDLPAAYQTLDAAKAAGVDAIIASDMACILYCRKIGLEVHISTQLNLEQVKAIHEAIVSQNICGPSGQLVRIEMFAHGAFCMATSGKCYLSLAAYGESANRGACMQVCRRGYMVTDYETGFQVHIDNKYLMSPKDLCTIDFLDKFVEAGVKVFKIEGRARSADYVKITSECYREAADAVADGTYTPELGASYKKRLATVFNRGFWDGYYLGAPMGEWSAKYGSSATRTKVYVGKVTNWFAKIGVVEVQVEARDLHQGDQILFIGHTTGAMEMKVEELWLDFKPVEVVRQGLRCSIAVPLNGMPEDKINPDAEAGDKIHPRRGDKVFIWTLN